MKAHAARGNCMLALTALIWGVSFVAQSVGMEFVGPFTFNAVRCLLGGVALLLCIRLLSRGKKSEGNPRTLLLGGTLCGLVLFAASSLQQIGLQYTTVGKSGFITALYIVIIPLIGLFFHRIPSARAWISVGLALLGIYLLCVTEELSIEKGDLLVLLGSFFFAVHIYVIDYFAGRADGVRMSCIQFFVCGLISLIPMFWMEQPQLTQILAAWLPIAYAGILSCGVAYTLQIIAQQETTPVVAGLILSTESVFAVLAGWLLLGQGMSLKEGLGCALLITAIVLVQLPGRNCKSKID